MFTSSNIKKFEQDEVEYSELVSFLETLGQTDQSHEAAIRVGNILNIPQESASFLPWDLSIKIKSLKIEELNTQSHGPIYKSLLHFYNLEELSIMMPEYEQQTNSLDVNVIQHFLGHLDALPNLQSIDLEFHFKQAESAQAIFTKFLVSGAHIRKKRITISKVNFDETLVYNEEEVRKIGSTSQTKNLSINILGDNLKKSPRWFELVTLIYPQLEVLSLDFLGEEMFNFKKLSNATPLSEYINIAFDLTQLKELSINLPTWDIRGIADYGALVALRSQTNLQKIKLPEFIEQYLWVHQVDSSNKISAGDLEALDELWDRFPKLKTIDLD